MNREEVSAFHGPAFVQSNLRGVELKLLDERLAQFFDLEVLGAALDPNRDDLLTYTGTQTMRTRYMLSEPGGMPLEVPQFFWMRVSMGLALNEEEPTQAAIRFYDNMSRLEYLAAGSTLVNAGTGYSQLSNCFVLQMDDDIEHIVKSVRAVMWLTKGTGGIGFSVSRLRSEGSPIRSNNTTSTGPIPFMHIIDSTLRAVSRGGKKFGSLCFYIENWHLDFPQFLDRRQNSGDPYYFNPNELLVNKELALGVYPYGNAAECHLYLAKQMWEEANSLHGVRICVENGPGRPREGL